MRLVKTLLTQFIKNALYFKNTFLTDCILSTIFIFIEKKCDEMKSWIALIMAISVFFFESAGMEAAEVNSQEEKITINLASRILTFWRNGKKVIMYPIAVGAPESQTPMGSFSVLEMEENPEWIDPKDTKQKVASGEANPLGYRWMRFYHTYGIHGTNKPSSIGEYVSNGCIRLKEENVEELYELTDIGTPVEIDYERIVIERTADGRVAYYIYPDGYHLQALNVSKVKQALAEFGVADFTSDAEIAEKIENSDGNPTFLPCTYRVEINDLWISGQAVKIGGNIILPVSSLSAVTKRRVSFNEENQMLRTDLGTAKGEQFEGKWYVGLADVQSLFNLTGELGKDGIIRLRDVQAKPVPEESRNEVDSSQAAISIVSDGNHGGKR